LGSGSCLSLCQSPLMGNLFLGWVNVVRRGGRGWRWPPVLVQSRIDPSWHSTAWWRTPSKASRRCRSRARSHHRRRRRRRRRTCAQCVGNRLYALSGHHPTNATNDQQNNVVEHFQIALVYRSHALDRLSYKSNTIEHEEYDTCQDYCDDKDDCRPNSDFDGFRG